MQHIVPEDAEPVHRRRDGLRDAEGSLHTGRGQSKDSREPETEDCASMTCGHRLELFGSNCSIASRTGAIDVASIESLYPYSKTNPILGLSGRSQCSKSGDARANIISSYLEDTVDSKAKYMGRYTYLEKRTVGSYSARLTRQSSCLCLDRQVGIYRDRPM